MRSPLLYTILLCYLLIGCTSLFGKPGDSQTLYVITGAESVESSEGEPTDRLYIRPIAANGMINSHKIVFGEEKHIRSYYRLAQWVEPPPRRFATLLQDALMRSNLFTEVVASGRGARSDLELFVSIDEFYHDTSERPGRAVLTVKAELFDRKNRAVATRVVIEEVVEAPSYDSEGAVAALTIASNNAIGRIVSWLRESKPS